MTYKRAKYLGYCLKSLANQSVKPDEVIVILKPSGDRSEEILSKFNGKLNLKIFLQKGSGVIEAYSIGISNSNGDIVLFLDDDAIADRDFVARYILLFSRYPLAGAFFGLVMKAEITGNKAFFKKELFYKEEDVISPLRRPLPMLRKYSEFFSKSALTGSTIEENRDCLAKSILFSGANMGFRKTLIQDFPLYLVYGDSKVGFWFENHLALHVVQKGYETLRVRCMSLAPIVYHITHRDSLTRRMNPMREFWVNYDRAMNFWRLKMEGFQINFFSYLIGQIVICRRRTPFRLLALLYSLIVGPLRLKRYRLLACH